MFFSRWLQETDRFVEKWSVARREWLKRLKTSGGGREKPFFLLSSAYEDFAGAAMDFVFGKDWEEYFDFSIFLAHKPAFFTSKKPFYHLGWLFLELTNIKVNTNYFNNIYLKPIILLNCNFLKSLFIIIIQSIITIVCTNHHSILTNPQLLQCTEVRVLLTRSWSRNQKITPSFTEAISQPCRPTSAI